MPIDPRTTSQMVDVSLNFPSFQRSSSLKAVVNWCQSNPEYTLMESIYQPDNKNQIWTGVIWTKLHLNGLYTRIEVTMICLIKSFLMLNKNIARGTTDPGYWVCNLNQIYDWSQFENICQLNTLVRCASGNVLMTSLN